MIRRPPRSTRVRSSAASDVYKRQPIDPQLGLRSRESRRLRWIQDKTSSRVLASQPTPGGGETVESGTTSKRDRAKPSDAGGTAAGADTTGDPATIEVANPATGEVIRSVAVDDAASVRETVARVRANQAEWEALGNAGRRRWLGRLRDWLLDNEERVIATMQAETGKVRADAVTENFYLADLIN